MEDNQVHHSHNDHHTHTRIATGGYSHVVYTELLAHLPFAAFSVACGFVVLSILYFIGLTIHEPLVMRKGYHVMFHSFHYLHIVYAVMGTMVAFSRFSPKLLKGIAVSLISPAIFCTLSDVILPAIAGRLLGVGMHVHICFLSWHDLMNVIPLMLIGLVTGLAMRHSHASSLGLFSLKSHFVHILISSLASLFYVVSHGFDEWHGFMGLLFFLLVIAVVVPCTVSDIVVPLYFARDKSV